MAGGVIAGWRRAWRRRLPCRQGYGGAAVSISTLAIRIGRPASMKPKSRWWAASNCGAKPATPRQRDRQGRIGAVVAQAAGGSSAGSALRPGRPGPRRPPSSPGARPAAARRPGPSSARGCSSPACLQAADLGLADAPGGEQACRSAGRAPRGSPERLGHPAGGLDRRAAEGDQGVAARIEAALGGDVADRPGTVCSTATRTKPSAAASTLAAPMARASSSSRERAPPRRPAAGPRPGRTQRCRPGSSRPSTRLASVTVAGPSRP